MPIGVPIKTPITVISRLPTMALRRPPAAPGGGVISVKTSSDRPPKPSYSRVPRISTSTKIPTAAAKIDRATTARLRRRRRSEEHTSELQSLMRISYAVFCLQKKKQNETQPQDHK